MILGYNENFESLTWALAEGESNSYPLLIRFREFPGTFAISKYQQRINIFWRMRETDANGLPTEGESSRLASFEHRLISAVELDEHSILAGALTCNGEKEFIFYTTDVPGFIARLRKMAQENEPYPITIQRYDDPDWSYFKAVIPKGRHS
jgi:hypothetical protein